jgi:hypothetical protein
LNYDNTVELAGASAGIGIDTGFQAWSKLGTFKAKAGKVFLLKLHGSINWELSSNKMSIDRPLPSQSIKEVYLGQENFRQFRPAIVFGGKNKLTVKGPFLRLLQAFDNHLSKADVLWVIGYSFRDEHVNEYIGNWFNNDPNRRINIVNPNIKSIETAFTKDLLHGHAKSRVQFIAEKASSVFLSLGKEQ